MCIRDRFIEVKDAVKKYGKGEAEVFALNKASLNAEKGEICVILGSSGSGKSTLLNMLGGLDVLDSGSIMIDGREISKLSSKDMTEFRRSDIGFVFQFYNLIPDLTVCENIEVVSDISASPLDIDDIMKALEIDKYSYRFPKELSGGQQQRTAIGRASVSYTHLDVYKRQRLAFLRRLAAQRGLLILTDSDGAGFVIRNYLAAAIPADQLKHAYIPEVPGKERRKAAASKEGLLGVEGIDNARILETLRRAGATRCV